MTSNKAKRKPPRWKSGYTNPSRLSEEYSKPVFITKKVAESSANPTAEDKPKIRVQKQHKRKPNTRVERSKFKDCIITYLQQHGKADKKKLTINQIRDRLLDLRPEFRSITRSRLISEAGAILFEEMLREKMDGNTNVVYFVSYENQPDYVKIGFTKSIRRRIAEFETANWQDVVIRFLSYLSGAKVEQAYHKRFQFQRVRQGREWFKVEGNLKSFLSNKPVITIDQLLNDPFIYQKFDERQPVPEGEGPIIST